jgi:undecaprenyl-diphosphatase
VIVPWLFGWKELVDHPDLNRTFDVALHMGTFVGAVAYFWRDIVRLVLRERRVGWLLVIASVPAALVGAVLDNFVNDQLSAVWLIGLMLIVFGVVLWWADRRPEGKAEESFDSRSAIVMGIAQAAALQPGVSRSGVTISAARALGFNRDAAARLSFLMSIPIIAGAGLFKGLKVAKAGGLPPGMAAPFFWGILASAITGFIAIWFLLRLVRTRGFTPFVVYRILAGLFVIAVAIAR